MAPANEFGSGSATLVECDRVYDAPTSSLKRNQKSSIYVTDVGFELGQLGGVVGSMTYLVP